MSPSGTGPPRILGEAKIDREIIGSLFMKLRELYAKDGGKFPDPIMKTTWNYSNPNHPNAEEVLREISGRALTDVVDAKDKTKVLVPAGQQLAGFGQLQDDGSTMCGNWLYCGSYSQAGNLTARRDANDPGNLGNNLTWGYSWPANRRVLYNRAGADPSGKPWDAKRGGIRWDGTRVGRHRRTDMAPTLDPDSGARSVHHDYRRYGASVCAGTERRSIPRALRAVRNANRHQPAACESHQQSGRARVQGRHGIVRQS